MFDLLDSLPQWGIALLYSMLAGIAIPFGALLARIEHIHPKWLEKEFRHSVIAFGGGALIAAVSLVLVPKGIETTPPFWVVFWFFAGGVCFYGLDRVIQSHGGRFSQLIAMVSDFIPEAMALGAILLEDKASALLLVLLIGLQNLPEGFNAYREIIDQGKHKAKVILLWFFAISLMGPLSAFTGMTFLSAQPAIMGGIMMFAAGGILYLVFQDIAPQAYLKRKWAPPLGAVMGFGLGLIGHLML